MKINEYNNLKEQTSYKSIKQSQLANNRKRELIRW